MCYLETAGNFQNQLERWLLIGWPWSHQKQTAMARMNWVTLETVGCYTVPYRFCICGASCHHTSSTWHHTVQLNFGPNFFLRPRAKKHPRITKMVSIEPMVWDVPGALVSSVLVLGSMKQAKGARTGKKLAICAFLDLKATGLAPCTKLPLNFFNWFWYTPLFLPPAATPVTGSWDSGSSLSLRIKRSMAIMKPLESTKLDARLNTATATAGPCIPRPKEMAITPAPTSPRGHIPRDKAKRVRKSASFR